ncbi:hypothetical protein [uncultured Bifidobacterium sp.]|uniref:hypothetical protein n=1 Tax=uncultured Bifidobacterium sp. TaxID=165187 RepID=UPI0025961333|nr:hypothetical protein [uncultured Bifidobacterium sp.]
MTAALTTPTIRRIGKPIMLTEHDIQSRRATLEEKYGDAATLRAKKAMGVISTDELMALQRFDDFDYLEKD